MSVRTIVKRGDVVLQEDPLGLTYSVSLVPPDGLVVLLATRLGLRTARALAWAKVGGAGNVHEVSAAFPEGRTLTDADFV